jgi:hypothetical protein
MDDETFAILKSLDNSVWLPRAADGKSRDAGFIAAYHLSSIWKEPSHAHSGGELASTLEVDGKIECHTDRADC